MTWDFLLPLSAFHLGCLLRIRCSEAGKMTGKKPTDFLDWIHLLSPTLFTGGDCRFMNPDWTHLKKSLVEGEPNTCSCSGQHCHSNWEIQVQLLTFGQKREWQNYAGKWGISDRFDHSVEKGSLPQWECVAVYSEKKGVPCTVLSQLSICSCNPCGTEVAGTDPLGS